ncbi:MAG: glutamate synthase large subunit [Candidatus Omnitrophica bacterium]|nr:glutamate synthase large subunit [Candidatus Omnitrophota bacterium]
MIHNGLPEGQGLYDPRFEHDSCGVGFVCHVNGLASHDCVANGLKVLGRLSHRGATGADPKTGDGAGVLIQVPHEFSLKAASACGITLPAQGLYATGLVFLPKSQTAKNSYIKIFEKIIQSEGMKFLGWRKVPVNSSVIGDTARATEPDILQPFIAKGPQDGVDQLRFERHLYIARKKIENAVRSSASQNKEFFYITNLSSRTLSYKGLLMPSQVEGYFPDLRDEDMKSAICMVHSRYSTNTFPTWERAQPFRFIAHNGEINTLRGNINWMRAREGLLKSDLFGDALGDIYPIIVPGGSDSATFDNVFELLVLSGRSIAQVVMMMIPYAWQQHRFVDSRIKDFYEYNASIMEPWDGPAAIAFTDGVRVGACLDRNGLRPARYLITKDNMVVMASEVGVLDINPCDIAVSGRLEPGKIFFINTKVGRIIDNMDLKREISYKRPYGAWLKEKTVRLDEVPPDAKAPMKTEEEMLTALKAFGYSREDLAAIIKPMAEKGTEPLGSMGNDTPHAVLSKKPQLLYTYFKQLFAQVTNPPIDPIREELVMSLGCFIGPELNMLKEGPEHCHRLFVRHPIITDEELVRVRSGIIDGFRTKTISTLFNTEDEKGFTKAMDRVCREAESAIGEGYTFLVLSDKGAGHKNSALPALLSAGAVHHHLVRKALRSQIGIIVESAEPREVHHFALLFSYGADCVNPYLAYETIRYIETADSLESGAVKGILNYRKAIEKGILKVLSKMGISTLQSYKGAQIFEALGLHKEVIEKCFEGTVSRIGGATFETLRKECLARHSDAYPKSGMASPLLVTGGLYQWRRDGEFHLWNPESITALQEATRTGKTEQYKEFARLINDQSANPTTIRSLFSFKKKKSIPLSEVEPASQILKRFATGAMSFGSISRNAHETIAVAMNRIGGKSNTGEGGEDPARFTPRPNGDLARSAIKQVASGRFGVTTNYLVNADELQIKIAQGAKPGEGGQLPGHKVSVTIAATRYTTQGVTLISPPPHHDIYSIEDLAQLIFDLKNVNPKARISVKLVSEIGVGTIAAGVAKGHADMILIAGGDGGTGASPLSSIKHAGLPWELGLSETHQTLVMNDLRSRVRLQTDGQLRTGRDVAIACLLGAEEFGFATGILIVLGCVMLRHCHLNNCSVGVATQDEILEKRFTGKPENIVNYLMFVAEELRGIMASLGLRNVDEMVGRTDLLEINEAMLPWKAADLDLSPILYRPKVAATVGIRQTIKQDHGLSHILDRELIKRAEPAIKSASPVKIDMAIENTDRSTGAMLSGEIAKRYGEAALPEDTIYCLFHGVAGQSLGAFLTKGTTFELEGMANDYVGKGIFGGKIIIRPPAGITYKAEENIIIGNTTFYGAINGQAYIRGVAGERFCIRNSGLLAVVEGIGDHGCEYMTGGRVVVLGRTGRNFGAGMSGGIAYVYDIDNRFGDRCNTEMVALEALDDGDRTTLRELLHNHLRYTGSATAKEMLDDFQRASRRFVKVMPIEYKRMLEKRYAPASQDLLEVYDG